MSTYWSDRLERLVAEFDAVTREIIDRADSEVTPFPITHRFKLLAEAADLAEKAGSLPALRIVDEAVPNETRMEKRAAVLRSYLDTLQVMRSTLRSLTQAAADSLEVKA